MSDGIVTSVGQMGLRWTNDGRLYVNNASIFPLEEANVRFVQYLPPAFQRGARRVQMRCWLSDLKGSKDHLEALIPYGDKFLAFFGKNNNELLSPKDGAIRNLPDKFKICELSKEFSIDYQVYPYDAEDLFVLWQQFGWSEAGIREWIGNGRDHDLVVIRHKKQIIGAMIAESLSFANAPQRRLPPMAHHGGVNLIEVTEMAIVSDHQGNGLAKTMVQYLSRLYSQRSKTIIFGEFNLASNAQHLAISAGMTPAIHDDIDGVLMDSVEIGGSLRSLQVMYWTPQALQSLSQKVPFPK